MNSLPVVRPGREVLAGQEEQRPLPAARHSEQGARRLHCVVERTENLICKIKDYITTLYLVNFLRAASGWSQGMATKYVLTCRSCVFCLTQFSSSAWLGWNRLVSYWCKSSLVLPCTISSASSRPSPPDSFYSRTIIFSACQI